MPYTTGAFPASAEGRPALRTDLGAAGFTLVTQDFSYTNGANTHTLDVYRSPAASNVEGKDWYVGVSELVSGTQRILYFYPIEVWDTVANTGVRYSPASNNVAPTTDGSIGATAAGPAAMAGSGVGWDNASGANFILTADANRFILTMGIPGASGASLYIGLLDRMHPPSVDGFPLVTMIIYTGTSSSTTGYGYATREPGQGAAGTYNFRLQFYGNLPMDRLFITNYYANADAISGRQVLSPAVAHAARAPYTSARGLLRGPKMGTAAAGATDTLTETALDGTNRSYYCVYPGISLFVPQF